MFQYRIWGGRHLEKLLNQQLPGPGKYGEAWILCDRPEFSSKVANGPLRGQTITDLMEESRDRILGDLASRFHHFPLLLKFLDAQEVLSVQVHPSDEQTDLLPPGEHGKTEAWVVLQADEKSLVYGGLAPGVDKESFEKALKAGKSQDQLASFKPKVGDAIFVPAGTVHTMGGIVAFEVQENSDVTFRLYDWGKVDAKTGKPRELHIQQGLASMTFPQGPVAPVEPVEELTEPVLREKLVECGHFTMWRMTGRRDFKVGIKGSARIVVCLEGEGQFGYDDSVYKVRKGETWLLPASVGVCDFSPRGEIQLIELGMPTIGSN
jgi:mannose-6-phosphate isomerase